MPLTHTHTVKWDVPDAPPDLRGLSGLEIMQRALGSGEVRSPIAALMDMKLVSCGPGEAVMEAYPGVQHVNPINIVHGGFAATVLDAAVWSAVQTMSPPGETVTTLELKVSYARAMTPATGPVRATGRLIHRGGRIALAEGDLRDTDGKILAHATSTLMVLKP